MKRPTSLGPLAFYLRPPKIYTPGWRTRMLNRGRDQEYRTVANILELVKIVSTREILTFVFLARQASQALLLLRLWNGLLDPTGRPVAWTSGKRVRASSPSGDGCVEISISSRSASCTTPVPCGAPLPGSERSGADSV